MSLLNSTTHFQDLLKMMALVILDLGGEDHPEEMTTVAVEGEMIVASHLVMTIEEDLGMMIEEDLEMMTGEDQDPRPEVSQTIRTQHS